MYTFGTFKKIKKENKNDIKNNISTKNKMIKNIINFNKNDIIKRNEAEYDEMDRERVDQDEEELIFDEDKK